MPTINEKSLAAAIAIVIQIQQRLTPEGEPDDMDNDVQLMFRDAVQIPSIDWVWQLGHLRLFNQWESADEAQEYLSSIVAGEVSLNLSEQDVIDLRGTILCVIDGHLDDLWGVFSWDGDKETYVAVDGEQVVVYRFSHSEEPDVEIARF